MCTCRSLLNHSQSIIFDILIGAGVCAFVRQYRLVVLGINTLVETLLICLKLSIVLLSFTCTCTLCMYIMAIKAL